MVDQEKDEKIVQAGSELNDGLGRPGNIFKQYGDRLSTAYWAATSRLPEIAKTKVTRPNGESFEHAPALDVFLDVIGDLYRESA